MSALAAIGIGLLLVLPFIWFAEVVYSGVPFWSVFWNIWLAIAVAWWLYIILGFGFEWFHS